MVVRQPTQFWVNGIDRVQQVIGKVSIGRFLKLGIVQRQLEFYGIT